MAAFLAAKVGAELVQRTYAVPVDADDNLASVATSATDVTVVSAEIEGNEVLLNLSGGVDGVTASVVLTATTDKGRTLVQTLYVPIIASAAQIADTARQYVDFALRRIVGIGQAASAEEIDDALERLTAMIAEWRECGADIGAPFPLSPDTVIYCPDYAASALRYNLLIDCASLYGQPVTQIEAMRAARGLQLIKSKNLPDVRADVYY